LIYLYGKRYTLFPLYGIHLYGKHLYGMNLYGKHLYGKHVYGIYLYGKRRVKHVISPADDSEFPSLLHFAASHGLVKLVSVLLGCPGASIANEMKNGASMNPAQMAQSNGHFELAEKLYNVQVQGVS
jgi:hypothetical protein